MNYLPAPWKKWVAENVLLQADPQTLVKTLVENGFDAELAAQEVSAAASHPYIEAARSLARRIKKRDWVLDTLRILANQSPAAGSVERKTRLSKDEFFEQYYSRNRPVVMQGALDGWKALTLWTPEYLKRRLGDQVVEIQANRRSDPNYEVNSRDHKKAIRFGEYIDLITAAGSSNDYYMTANNSAINAEVLKGLWDDIDLLPEYLDGSDPKNRGFFWFGPAGTVTPLHHDLTNNFMAQVYGRKLVKLIAPAYLPFVYNHKHCYSQVDLENIDTARYPLFRHVRVLELTLAPGELLFLPVGWWHHVRGLEITMTMSFTNFRFNNDFYSFYTTTGEL